MATILLIEDEHSMSDALAQKLRHDGFDITQAFDGEEGLHMIQSQKPDLVVLDLIIPKLSGFGVLSAVKSMPATKNIPVIIVTTLDSLSDINRGLELGADDYLVKFHHTLTEMTEKIKKLFARTRDSRSNNISII